MSLLIQYLVKLTISLAIVWLFYQFVLRRLTFYNSNRWYLLAYTLLSFYIPFINISFILNDPNESANNLIRFIPAIHQYTSALEEASRRPTPIWSTRYDKWDWTAFILMIGAGFLFLRFIARYISFIRIRNRSKLILQEGIKVYQVDENIIPFSFGNAVFINRSLHTEEELREIVRHEFVHVRQKHTIDIIWAEFLCILNWYNPFAWLLRRSIRQNLEFIADNKVVENGIDKKEYQFLLLKVIGNTQFSIATQFNFSSLKKRIAMMNKTKSTKRQVIRFLLLLPVLAVILLSFRESFSDPSATQTDSTQPVFTDTIPEVKEPNNKGYLIDIKDNKGECMVVVKDKDKKVVTRMPLTDWNKKAEYYENLYGEIPPAPAKTAEPASPILEQWVKSANPDVKSVSVTDNHALVTLRNGKVENYDLNKADQKKDYEIKYGKLPEPPLPPAPAKAGQALQLPTAPVKTEQPGEPAMPPLPPTPPSKVIGVKPKEGVKADFDLKDNVITVTPVNGRKEIYDLKNDKEKKLFEEKYGDPVLAEDINTVANANINAKINSVLATTLKSNLVSNVNVNPVTIANTNVDGKLAADNLINAKLATTVSSPAVVNLKNNIDTTIKSVIETDVDVDIFITIPKTATEADLEKLITKMKAKGYELKFANKNYHNGILTNISVTVKHKGKGSTFLATDFNDLTIAVFRDGDEVSFKMHTNLIKIKKEII
jgi:beta-lactamase regulating signal transducer with metallopeptidase domain